MSADLRIFEIENNNEDIILKKITTIYNWEVIEKLLEISDEYWCIKGECGAIFELSGEELNDIKGTLEFEDNNLIKYQFDDLKYYECRLSY